MVLAEEIDSNYWKRNQTTQGRSKEEYVQNIGDSFEQLLIHPCLLIKVSGKLA